MIKPVRYCGLMLILVIGFTVAQTTHEQLKAEAFASTAGLCSSGIDKGLLAAPSVFRYGLTGTELQEEFFDAGKGTNTFNDQGYRPIRLTGYRVGDSTRFATNWVKIAGPGWKGFFGKTAEEFAQFIQQHKDEFRPIDVSGYNTPAGVRYAAIWEKNTTGVGWQLRRDVSLADMQKLVDESKAQGLVPVRVEAYVLNGDSHYISLWVKDSCDWRMHHKMTREQYQSLFDQYKDQSFRLVHLDSHTDDGKVYFSGIWWKQSGPVWQARSDRDWYLFQRFVNNNWCAGFSLSNFYATEIPGGVRYGGIWTFNALPNINASSSLSLRVRKEVDCAPGRAGAAIINLTTGKEILWHADQSFGTSSTIKIAILYALLRRVDADPSVTLDTTLNVGTQYGSNGPSGTPVPVIEGPRGNCATNGTSLTANNSYSLRCLAQLMIRVSHNWATNRLIDYVGEAQINQQLANLGLSVTRLRRYMKGSGPSPDAEVDYRAGRDNTSTPREITTLLRLIHQNQGSLLSRASYTFFWNTLGLAGGIIDNLLSQGVAANWQNLVTIFRKPGSNPWNGSVGDFNHRPQIGSHLQRSEAGRLNFSNNGQVVFYAVFVDEADSPDSSLQNMIACIGVEVVREYAQQTTGTVLNQCQ